MHHKAYKSSPHHLPVAEGHREAVYGAKNLGWNFCVEIFIIELCVRERKRIERLVFAPGGLLVSLLDRFKALLLLMTFVHSRSIEVSHCVWKYSTLKGQCNRPTLCVWLAYRLLGAVWQGIFCLLLRSVSFLSRMAELNLAQFWERS